MFSRSIRMNLFTALFVPLTIALGLWQLDRGAEKRAMEEAYLGKLTELPVAPTVKNLNTPFQRIRLSGLYAEEAFLVDNQIVDGRTGYWVVQRFVSEGENYLLNRGFIAAPASRQELPVVTQPDSRVELVGVVWPFTGLVPVYDDDSWSQGWPKRVQRMDIARMADVASAHAVELRLERGQPGVLQAAPFAQVLSDAKHLGYAATWFGLCVALVALYIFFVWRQRLETREGEQTA